MNDTRSPHQKPFALFGLDFTFAYDDWLQHPAGLGQLPPSQHGTRVAIIGAVPPRDRCQRYFNGLCQWTG